ncbi:MAG: class I mannose-6-phosphate isomerase [Mariniblastus sp.]|nr:class I mannose-6-phosphate isomerase [Mariniblastus sp.]
MHPLRFQPLFQRYLWGGSRLSTVLGKPSGPDSCAESWEIADHHQFQSIVQGGPHDGKSLAELMHSSGNDIVGPETFKAIHDSHVPESLRGRFPLLLKFLDANQNLSVQVHPDDKGAAHLPTPDLGKTEFWYVIHADPGAKIYAGLKAGVSAVDFRAAVEQGHVRETLHSFEPQAGDGIFIPAGTVHAIGAGLLIAEIQQASNTTFRVYDWDRVDSDGKPRPLHIEQAVRAIDFSMCPVTPVRRNNHRQANSENLVECDKFRICRWTSEEQPVDVEIGNDESFHVLMVTRGSIRVAGEPALLGQTVLLPACLKSTQVELLPGSEFLQIFLPAPTTSRTIS